MSEIPPNDPAAERQVLCGLLTDFEVAYPVVHRVGLRATDFYQWANATAFGLVLECYESTTDDFLPRILYRRVRQLGLAADFGGIGRWLGETLEAGPPLGRWDEEEIPVSVWVVVAAERVRQLSLCRRLIHKAREVLRDARMPCHDPATYERQLQALEVA